MEKRLGSALNRRDFLRIAGLATGATVTLPLQAYARLIFDGRPPLRVGMIVPRSTIQPGIGMNLADGMRLQFAEAGWTSTRLVLREVASGSEISAAQQLLREERVEILTGMFNPRTIHRLRADLEAAGTLFINLEGGANAFAPRETSPLMYQNSLGYWQSSWAMGNWAAKNIGTRAAVVSSFYESGFDSFYAFSQGFAAAGGSVTATEVSNAPMSVNDPVGTMKTVAATKPDVIFVSASGNEALELVRGYHAAGLTERIPLAVSSFCVQGDFLSTLGTAAVGISSCLPWTPTLSTPENQAFCRSFRASTGRTPDPFAVLGYDSGSMIVTAVAAAAGRAHNNQDLRKALERMRVSSPRGTFGLAPASGSCDAPLYICRVERQGNTVQNSVISQAASLEGVSRQARLADLMAHSGWTNVYLCA